MSKAPEGIGDRYQRETKYIRNRMGGGFLDWSKRPESYKRYPDHQRQIALPEPQRESGGPLWTVISQRRSRREFAEEPISLAQLSQLLWATQGVTYTEVGFLLRACPSAGALYPIETYLVVNRVEEIPFGLYHYNVKEAQLILLKEGRFAPELCQAGLGQEMLGEAACDFVWTAVVGRSKWKYRERAYRYIYMDAGHIGQTLYLAATALNLGCCTVGAFFDEEVDRVIGVDGKNEISVYLGAVGRPR